MELGELSEPRISVYQALFLCAGYQANTDLYIQISRQLTRLPDKLTADGCCTLWRMAFEVLQNAKAAFF